MNLPPETRRQKAVRLCSTGRVLVHADTPTIAVATVEGDHGTYTVSISAPDRYTCTCDWARYGRASERPCSHVLALAHATQRYVRDPHD